MPAGGRKIVTLKAQLKLRGPAGPGLLVALSFILSSGPSLVAQAEETSDRELSLTEVRSLRHQVESSSAPEEGRQKQLLELYDQAMADLESANQAQMQVRRHERERTRIESRVAALRIELGRLQDRAELSLPDDLNAERLETALAREQSLLGSLRVALRDIQELAAERLRRRTEVAQRLGTLDQEIESVNAELREASELVGSDKLRQAARTRALARRAALLAGSDELRAELRLVEERAVLLPWQRDVAELKVARSERVTAMLEVVLRDLRLREAHESLKDVRTRAEEIAEELPELSDMTEAVTRLAETLWAPDGVMAQSLLADSALTETRKNITQLKSIIALTERRFEAVGHTGDITQWWPITPAGFPRLAEVRSEIQQQEALIPEVQHQLIQFEQQRLPTSASTSPRSTSCWTRQGRPPRAASLLKSEPASGPSSTPAESSSTAWSSSTGATPGAWWSS